jgi:pimeloyl-ACP methyl ester carboxylesterase
MFGNPVLVISGNKSSYVTNSNEFQKLFTSFDANKDLIYINNAGHWPHLE